MIIYPKSGKTRERRLSNQCTSDGLPSASWILRKKTCSLSLKGKVDLYKTGKSCLAPQPNESIEMTKGPVMHLKPSPGRPTSMKGMESQESSAILGRVMILQQLLVFLSVGQKYAIHWRSSLVKRVCSACFTKRFPKN